MKYYLREGTTIVYLAGKEQVLPAADIIHIYRREFPKQVRGFSALNACLNDLKQIEDLDVAELFASKVAACQGVFYERNGQTPVGDFLSDQEANDQGTFIQELAPGFSSVVPNGYIVKSVSSNHPNNNFYDFNKAILKKVASSLGLSYNKLIRDYEHISFSSLKEAVIDERTYFEDIQNFLLNSWKEIEYKLFIESLALHSDLLKPSELKDALRHHSWITQRRLYFDPAREIISDKYALGMGLKSPIEIIEGNGKDPDELLKSWAQWKAMCKEYDLDFDYGNKKEEVELSPDESKDDEETMLEDGRKN